MNRAKERTRSSKFALLAVVALICVPVVACRSGDSLDAARERVLKNDLFVMRQAIDTYTLDKQKPPQSLQDLVDAHDLPRIPVDPFTNKPDWALQIDDIAVSPKEKTRGLSDVHSSSTKKARNGTPLSSW